MTHTRDTLEIATQLRKAAANYTGSADVLRNAIGTVTLCEVYGWRIIKLLYGVTVYKKYQQITGLDFETTFPAETELSHRFLAWKVWKATGRFWDLAKRRLQVPGGRKQIESENVDS